MAQFIAYRNKNPDTNKTYPFVVDIQSNVLDDLQSTVVIPISPLSVVGETPISKLCPIVAIQNEKYVAVTSQLAGIDRKIVGPQVADLSEYRADFIAAINVVISGL
jgi:toxin CcdB